MDWWIAVDTMEVATRASLIISAVATWLRLCVIGAAVWRVLVLLAEDAAVPAVGRFFLFWATVSLALAVALLAVDLWLNALRFTEGEIGGERVRTLWLASIYAQVFAFFLAARLLFGAAAFGRGSSLGAAWGVTGFWRSLWLFTVLLLFKLVIENALVTLLSYIPIIAPFWFIPDELSESRFFVGQGTHIAAETLGVLVYVAFLVAVDRQTTRRV